MEAIDILDEQEPKDEDDFLVMREFGPFDLSKVNDLRYLCKHLRYLFYEKRGQ